MHFGLCDDEGTTLQYHLLLTYLLTSAANSLADLEALWKCAGGFVFLNSLLYLKTLGGLRECKKPREGEKANMMLIFEIRTDLAVTILVNIISVPGEKNEKEICSYLEAKKLKSKQHRFINKITDGFLLFCIFNQIIKLVGKNCKSGLLQFLMSDYWKNEFNFAREIRALRS